MYGSDAYGVIDHAHCPVLLIPPDCQYDEPETIVFANDLKQDYPGAVQFITYLARVYQSHVIVTHLGPHDVAAHNCIEMFEKENEYINISSRLLPLENFHEQLARFASAVKAGLLVLIHHHGLTLDKFIGGSKSKKMLNHKLVPLLVLPA